MPESFLKTTGGDAAHLLALERSKREMRAQRPSTSPEMRKTSSIRMVMRLDPYGFVMCGQC